MKGQMELDAAKHLASMYVEELAPHCERIEIAGSIRRQKNTVGDIELVMIPKGKMHPQKPGRGGVPRPPKFVPTMAFIETVSQWEKALGDPWGKYTKRWIPEHDIALDIFMCSAENWGTMLLIRTGDWEFSKKFMGAIMPKRGYRQEEGFVHRDDKIVPVYEEKDMFELMKIPYIQPKDRCLFALAKY